MQDMVLAMFTLSQEYKAFCQDIVWRLTTAPNFKPDNESIERACQHAFKVASIFYPRWEVEYDALLVTNRHVLEEQDAIVIRFNLIEPRESMDFEVPLVSADKTSAVTFHSDSEIDVAVVKLDDSVLQRSGVHIQAFISNLDCYPLQQAGWGELRSDDSRPTPEQEAATRERAAQFDLLPSK